jgi:GMP synthase-like glutamine amidotransferase
MIIQHVACEGPGLLGDKLRNDGWETDIRCMDIPGTSLPVHLDSYQALLILGGPMGAYEENIYPYLYQVEELIREAAAKNIPTAGICLGAQLIARALGAEVFPNPQKEIGWSGININEEGKSTRCFITCPILCRYSSGTGIPSPCLKEPGCWHLARYAEIKPFYTAKISGLCSFIRKSPRR